MRVRACVRVRRDKVEKGRDLAKEGGDRGKVGKGKEAKEWLKEMERG